MFPCHAACWNLPWTDSPEIVDQACINIHGPSSLCFSYQQHVWCCLQVPVHHRLHTEPDGVLRDHGSVCHRRPQSGKCAVQLLLWVVESVHWFPDWCESNGRLVEVVVSTSIYCDACRAMLCCVLLCWPFLPTCCFVALSLLSHTGRPSRLLP